LKTQLQDIATIQTGVFAKTGGEGDLVYIQAGFFDDKGRLITRLFLNLNKDGIAERHLLKDGDVLFAAKGTKNFATVFESHNMPSVASTSFFVIRIIQPNVLPHFLAWVLNSQKVLNSLKEQSVGTGIPSISKRLLENVEFPMPSIQQQQIILNLVKLRNNEKAIIKQIESLKETKFEQSIYNAINQ
jgi:restriction endonuclease S subunit